VKNLLDERFGADLQEIKNGIAILFDPGQVVELRVPAKYGSKSGYFDDHEKLAIAVKRLSDSAQHEGIYYTLNVCNEALLARRAKNVVHDGVRDATRDVDVERRRWLLFDFDVNRPAHTSASKDEVLAAKRVLVTVLEALRKMEWPEPVVAFSGNGYHLLFCVNEPNDSETADLFKKCLEALAKQFATTKVTIDRNVSNASRLIKAYGSLAAKGVNTPERPHRYSKIKCVPSQLRAVTREQLEKLAATVPSAAKTVASHKSGATVTCDKVDEFLSFGDIAVKSVKDTDDGGKKWVLEACPFDPEHTNSPAVFRSGDGVLGFHCFHATCGEYNWAAFRSLIEERKREKFHFLNERAEVQQNAATYEKRSGGLTLVGPTCWPQPATKAAFHGLPGDFVRLIEPHSEADRVAVLAQLLVAFGSAVGRNPYFRVEADSHYPNINCVLVGATSKGRKGSSWGHVKRLFEAVDSYWAGKCILSGMSSGEGLIHAVRDPVMHPQQTRRGSSPDMGVEDKRLLVVESEFAQPLKLMTREGNILSTVIRQAWDSVGLYTLSKNTPARATGAHISIIGHITQDELRRYLNQTEQANGFGNRFLWFCVKRSKCLPEGGAVPEEELQHLVQRFASALEFAQGVQQMERDEGAQELWEVEYASLSEGHPGMLGAVTGRAESQVVRLSMLYALLDCSAVIRAEHLLAALALWNYSEESARYIFGGVVGDPTRDTILKALRSSRGGMTRTEISNLFAGHQTAVEITRALEALRTSGLTSCQLKATEGRSQECWSAVGGFAVA
jgi:hypothetical protein